MGCMRTGLSPLLLALSAALVRHGFAVLDMDLREHGQSAPAPLSMGYFEQRDSHFIGGLRSIHRIAKKTTVVPGDS